MADQEVKQKSFIKNFLTKIGQGFAYGLGIALAFVIVVSIAVAVSEFFGPKSAGPQLPGFKAYSPESGLEIISHESKRSGNSFIVIGKVRNNGTDKWQSMSIDVELFDDKDKFVDKCSSYISGTIRPDDERNFKVLCNRCNDDPLPDFERYTVNIVNANYQVDM